MLYIPTEWRNTAKDGRIIVSLDRIEEGLVVLVTHDSHTCSLPAAYLPEDSREGNVLDIS